MEITLILVLLVGTVVLFISERLSIDLVSLSVLAVLLVVALLAGSVSWVRADRWVTVPEALSGFANPAVLTVAELLVLSAGLQKTGAMAAVARGFTRIGAHPLALLIAIMVVAGLLSAVVNNTAAVAVFLPVVVALCARHQIPASRLLIPLSFAAQCGGVCTLIGSSTNLLVSSISEEAGHGAFSMFEFSRLGLLMLAACLVYFLLFGRWLLPARQEVPLTDLYQLSEYVTELRVMDDSLLVGRTLEQSRLNQVHEVQVIEILRDQQSIWFPSNEPLRPGDVLLVRGKIDNLMDLKRAMGLEMEAEFTLKDETLQGREMTLVEALVAPRSRLVDRTVKDLGFRWRYDAIMLAVQRRGEIIREQLRVARLQFGDVLLLLVPNESLSRLSRDDDFIMLRRVDSPVSAGGRGVMAVCILAAAVGLAAFNVLPIMVSALLGCIAMVLTRCLTMEQAYHAIDWKVIILLAGVLPLGLALERSGAAALLASGVTGFIGQFGPVAALTALYLVTATLSAFMTNNAAAVLLAPVAISMALKLGADPKPFLMAVTFAASTSFATPVGYQTNAMIYGPGGYRFTDFVKVGVPLNVLCWALAAFLLPVFWPL
jgi:di/tricarboxylate transporter